AFLLQNTTTPELLKLARTPLVLQAILTRPEIIDADRMVALGELAQARKTNLVAVLISELQEHAKTPREEPVGRRRRGRTPPSPSAVATLARLLAYQVPEHLKNFRPVLAGFTSGEVVELRQEAWAALALADGNFDRVWSEASKSSSSLSDLLGGIPALPDSAFRATAYARVKPLVDGGGDSSVRRAAILALVRMNHGPESVFTSLTDLIARSQDVRAAAQGLSILPRASWSRAQAGRAANGLVAWARTVPEGNRTSQDYSSTIQLASDLAG